jgi:hypothetical protein
MLGSVSDSGSPFWIWLTNNDDRTARVHDVAVPGDGDGRRRVRVVAAKAWAVFSMSAFDMPMAFTGYTALSVLRQTTDITPAFAAACSTLWLPITLVLTAWPGEELTRRHLFERGGVEDEIDVAEGSGHAVVVANVAEHESEPGVGETLAHHVLFGLVAAEDVDRLDAAGEQVPDHRRTERAGPTGDRHGCAVHAVRRHHVHSPVCREFADLRRTGIASGCG